MAMRNICVKAIVILFIISVCGCNPSIATETILESTTSIPSSTATLEDTKTPTPPPLPTLTVTSSVSSEELGDENALSIVLDAKEKILGLSSFRVAYTYSIDDFNLQFPTGESSENNCQVDQNLGAAYCVFQSLSFVEGEESDLSVNDYLVVDDQAWLRPEDGSWRPLSQRETEHVKSIGGFLHPRKFLDLIYDARIDNEYLNPDGLMREIAIWVDSLDFLEVFFSESEKHLLSDVDVRDSLGFVWINDSDGLIREFGYYVYYRLDGVKYNLWINYEFLEFDNPVFIPEIMPESNDA